MRKSEIMVNAVQSVYGITDFLAVNYQKWCNNWWTRSLGPRVLETESKQNSPLMNHIESDTKQHLPTVVWSMHSAYHM